MGYLKDQPSAGRDEPTKPEHFARMVEEFFQLDKRLHKMSAFMTTAKFASLEPVAQGLLAEQKAAMQHYHYVLNRRLEMLGFDKGNYTTYDMVDYSLPLQIVGNGQVQELGEPVEIGGYDIDRDGPPPFSA